MMKLPCKNGVAFERIFAKANPAANDKKIIVAVEMMVKNRLFRKSTSNLPMRQAMV